MLPLTREDFVAGTSEALESSELVEGACLPALTTLGEKSKDDFHDNLPVRKIRLQIVCTVNQLPNCQKTCCCDVQKNETTLSSKSDAKKTFKARGTNLNRSITADQLLPFADHNSCVSR